MQAMYSEASPLRTPNIIKEEETEEPVDIDEYFGQTHFDGAREITKEKNLGSFFQQKYTRVNNYLKAVEEETAMAATKARSSIRNYGIKLKLS